MCWEERGCKSWRQEAEHFMSTPETLGLAYKLQFAVSRLHICRLEGLLTPAHCLSSTDCSRESLHLSLAAHKEAAF